MRDLVLQTSAQQILSASVCVVPEASAGELPYYTFDSDQPIAPEYFEELLSQLFGCDPRLSRLDTKVVLSNDAPNTYRCELVFYPDPDEEQLARTQRRISPIEAKCHTLKYMLHWGIEYGNHQYLLALLGINGSGQHLLRHVADAVTGRSDVRNLNARSTERCRRTSSLKVKVKDMEPVRLYTKQKGNRPPKGASVLDYTPRKIVFSVVANHHAFAGLMTMAAYFKLRQDLYSLPKRTEMLQINSNPQAVPGG